MVLPEWKINLIKNLSIQIKNGKKLVFIHIPKCAGTYASQYLKDLKITNRGHSKNINKDEITFAIIRHPINRFESLLNYRLDEKIPRSDWPQSLYHVYENKSINLDEIINKMTDKDIISFSPYRTLEYWIEGIYLLLTIEEFIPALKLFGYKITKIYDKINVSKKERGTISSENKQRLSIIFKRDIEIYNNWTKLFF